jgi:molybdopterin synthase catalytic subunit
MAESSPETSFDISVDFDGGRCALTSKELDTTTIIESVKSDETGANAVFIGTTRNTFQGILLLNCLPFR